MKHVLKRTVILLMLVGFTSGVCEVYAKVMDMKGNYVTMMGRLGHTGHNGVKSVPVNPEPQPVTVEQNTTSVVVSFLSSLGNLNITVMNEQGYPVYQKTVNAVSGASHTISSLSWSSGSYTILITDALGGALMGEFQIP